MSSRRKTVDASWIGQIAIGLVLSLLFGCGGSKDVAENNPAGPTTAPAVATPPLQPRANASGPSALQQVPDKLVTAPVPATSTTQPAAAETVAVKPLTDAKSPSGETLWGLSKAKRAIPLGTSGKHVLVFSPQPSTLAYINGNVIDLATGKSTGSIADTWPERTPRALSPDGRAFAVCPKNDNSDQAKILLFLVSSGKQVKELDVPQVEGQSGSTQNSVEQLEFLAPRSLMATCRQSIQGSLQFYDIASRDPPQVLPADYSDKVLAIHPDGNRILVKQRNSLSFLEVPKGTPGAALVPSGMRMYDERYAFSPAGDEVATFFGGRVVCWDQGGAIAMDETIGPQDRSAKGLVWLPDGKGWVLGSLTLFDRETKLPLWRVQGASISHFLDRDHAVIRQEGSLLVMPMPWNLIDQALAAYRNGVPALIKPGEAVQLQFKIGQIRFRTPQEVEKELTDALTTVCGSAGMQIGGAGNFVLEVSYAEEAGKTKDVAPDSGLPFGGRRSATTGQKITDTVIRVKVVLTRTDKNKTIWQWEHDSGESSVIFGDATDAAMRDQVAKFMMLDIKKQRLPVYLAEDPAIPSLPIVTIADK